MRNYFCNRSSSIGSKKTYSLQHRSRVVDPILSEERPLKTKGIDEGRAEYVLPITR